MTNFFGKLFGKGSESQHKTTSETRDTKQCDSINNEFQLAKVFASKNCWCAALFFVSKSLEINPNVLSAKELFMTALAANLFLITTDISDNENKSQSVDKLLKQLHKSMSKNEAELVVNNMISIFYVGEIQNKYGFIYDKFQNVGNLDILQISKSDLEASREIALALGDRSFPGQGMSIGWKFSNPKIESILITGITAQKESMILMLQTESSRNFLNLLQKYYKEKSDSLRELFTEKEFLEIFDIKKLNEMNNTEFQKYKDKLLLDLTKNIAFNILLYNIKREPIMNEFA